VEDTEQAEAFDTISLNLGERNYTVNDINLMFFLEESGWLIESFHVFQRSKTSSKLLKKPKFLSD
jgi:hypothetical protein